MIVDTSAIMAILQKEPEAPAFGAALTEGARIAISAATLVELCVVAESRAGAAVWAEVEALMADTGLASRSFDLALLRIPALYLNLIWLRDKEGDKDVLVPIGRTYPPIVAHHRYTSDELLGLLRSEAVLRAQQSDGAKGG